MASRLMRAAKLCAAPDCPNVQPCAVHGRKPWSTSRRAARSQLGGSAQQKRAQFILDRDDTICHVCGYPGADQADHVVPLAEGGLDTVENMAAIHSEPCHREKTDRESRAARGLAPEARPEASAA